MREHAGITCFYSNVSVYSALYLAAPWVNTCRSTCVVVS
jgi:hypothetical protein